MDNITEIHIEQFVCYPESLSGPEKERIQEAISDSPRLKELKKWFEEFYDELSTAQKGEGTAIPLQAVDFGRKSQRLQKQMVLAAKTQRESKTTSLETIITLISEEHKTVVRVLRERNSGKFQIHLLKEEKPSQNDVHVLHFEEQNMDIVIDESRHISIDSTRQLGSIDWECVNVALQRSVGFFQLKTAGLNLLLSGKQVQKMGMNLSVDQDDSELIIEVQKESALSSDVRLLVLLTSEHGYRLHRFNGNDSLQLNISRTVQTLKCWLFN